MKEFHRDDFANRTGLAQAWTVKSADRLFTDGRHLREMAFEWQPGDIVDLKLNVHTREHRLIALLEMETRQSTPTEAGLGQYDIEEASLIRTELNQPDEVDDVVSCFQFY